MRSQRRYVGRRIRIVVLMTMVVGWWWWWCRWYLCDCSNGTYDKMWSASSFRYWLVSGLRRRRFYIGRSIISLSYPFPYTTIVRTGMIRVVICGSPIAKLYWWTVVRMIRRTMIIIILCFFFRGGRGHDTHRGSVYIGFKWSKIHIHSHSQCFRIRFFDGPLDIKFL